MKNFLIALSAVFLFGCVTSPSVDIGSQVQIITSEQTKEFNCKRVGSVNSFDTLSMTTNAERRNAMIELKNKAAAAGANAIVVANQSTTFVGTEISGYAWDCENLD